MGWCSYATGMWGGRVMEGELDMLKRGAERQGRGSFIFHPLFAFFHSHTASDMCISLSGYQLTKLYMYIRHSACR